MKISNTISGLLIRTISYGIRPPRFKRVADFEQLAKTISLLRNLKINVFLDVGANRGFYAKHIRDAGYAGHLFSFEPIRSECDHIEKISSGDKKWTALNYALGADNGAQGFNVVELGGHTVLSSFLPLKDGLPSNSVLTPIRKLDEVLPQLISAIENPRVFLKMDTQGYDSQVIEGARNCMSLIQGIQSEISVIPLYEGMVTYTESLASYHQLGFRLVDLFIVNRTEDGLVREYDCLMRR